VTIVHGGGRFPGKGGTRLYHRFWKPENPKAIMVGVHGIAEHSGRYFHVAEHFANLGLAFHMFDLRGHGHSEGVRGHVDCHDDFVDDLGIFVDMVREKEKKLFLFGQSHGGTISLAYGLKYPNKTDGMILSSPLLNLGVEVPPDMLETGKELSKSDPTVMFQVPVDPYALSHDRSVCEKYAIDPLVFRMISARFGVEVLHVTDRLMRDAEKWMVPSLLLIAGDDRVCRPEGCKEFARRVKSKDFEVKIYDGFYHEIFNELEKEKVFSDVDAWLKTKI
jgi:acylglycerol lipase